MLGSVMKAANEVVQTPPPFPTSSHLQQGGVEGPEGTDLWQRGCLSLIYHFLSHQCTLEAGIKLLMHSPLERAWQLASVTKGSGSTDNKFNIRSQQIHTHMIFTACLSIYSYIDT